jgi:cyclopropane fatty-acyl-phospholipid synthase-like methyltransferase
MTIQPYPQLPWNNEQEFNELHAQDIFGRYAFYHVAMIGNSTEEFLQYIIDQARIVKKSRIVDLGCGSGFVVNALHDSCDIVGISNSSGCIAQCKKNFPNAHYYVANMEDYQRNNLTHLLSLESLGYANITRTFSNSFSNLQKQGIFYIKEWCLPERETRQEQENRQYWEYYWKYTLYKIIGIIAIAQAAGFTLLQYQNLSGKINNRMFLDSLQYHKPAYSPPHPQVDILIPTEFIFIKQ